MKAGAAQIRPPAPLASTRPAFSQITERDLRTFWFQFVSFFRVTRHPKAPYT